MEQEVDGDVLDLGVDGLLRCSWGAATPEYREYHDNEWGRPVPDDYRLFEKLCLEGFQSGLSWLTILRKRENFRLAFDTFDYTVVAGYGPDDVDRLLGDAGIVRHRGKIESTISNARRACALLDQGTTVGELLWSFAPEESTRPDQITREWLAQNPRSPESTAMSKELKRQGWSFVGPTTMYALMQAMGMVNDHQSACHVRDAVETTRRAELDRRCG
jgi:DNA-3-methyladenine glycosylase I